MISTIVAQITTTLQHKALVTDWLNWQIARDDEQQCEERVNVSIESDPEDEWDVEKWTNWFGERDLERENISRSTRLLDDI